MFSCLSGRRICHTIFRFQMKRKLDAISDPLYTRAMSSIQLNPREKQLKGLLLDVASFIDKSSPIPGANGSPEPIVLRWAGGWVRDKLLGRESHDIDTAISTMTGYSFALKMQEFCNVPENRTRHGMTDRDLGNLHKIKKNPEKSKNLETGTASILGLDVDFVNLRKETYADDSRNPAMEFGTAQEDAERRDATVNALFYNLHTGEVEDFVGGLQDMEARLIRTPLEPLQTFTDDPLRVLRLVRFASRLRFAIDPVVEKVMGDKRVLDALRLKISRERVGTEVEKMLKGTLVLAYGILTCCFAKRLTEYLGNHPKDSLALIDRLGLYHTTFTDPTKSDLLRPDISRWETVYACLDYLANRQTPGSLYDVLVGLSEETRYLAWVLAALVPWEQIPDASSQTKKKPPVVTLAAREGIKATNKVCTLVTAAHQNRQAIFDLRDIVREKAESMNDRGEFGMAIQQWESRGGHWRLQVLYAVLFDILTTAKADSDTGTAHPKGNEASMRRY